MDLASFLYKCMHAAPTLSYVDCLWSLLTACAITILPGTGTIPTTVQLRTNKIQSLSLFFFGVILPRARYCRSGSKVSIWRAREVEWLCPSVPKLQFEVNKIYLEQGYELHHITKTIHGMKLRNGLYLHEGQ